MLILDCRASSGKSRQYGNGRRVLFRWPANCKRFQRAENFAATYHWRGRV